MQVPTGTRHTVFLPVCLFSISALVLSGCAGSSPGITPAQPAPRATVGLSITPSAVMPGQSATLQWTSAAATSCTARGAWSGTLGTSGSATVMLQGATPQTYILTCAGAGLPGENSVTLTAPQDGAACKPGAALRSHRAKLTRAIAAARKAVATGTAGSKRQDQGAD